MFGRLSFHFWRSGITTKLGHHFYVLVQFKLAYLAQVSTNKTIYSQSVSVGRWWGLLSHFIVNPNLVLRIGWGFDNKNNKSNISSITDPILTKLLREGFWDIIIVINNNKLEIMTITTETTTIHNHNKNFLGL